MTPRPLALADSFGGILQEIQEAQHWTQRELAARLGVSPKTCGRYMLQKELPPVARRHGIVFALRDVERALLLRVARSLDIDADFVDGLPRPLHAVDPEVVRLQVEQALLDLSDRLDAGPLRTRVAVTVFLDKLIELGIDAAAARAVTTKPRARVTP